jgi:hypothetical protein
MKKKPSAQLSLLDADPWSDRGAVISSDEKYRYHLWYRRPDASNLVLFGLLNPSKADATTDDPTFTRCAGYARMWGHDGFSIWNPFAYRATDPKELPKVDDPVGPENLAHLAGLLRDPAIRTVVVGWGDGPSVPVRSERGKRWRDLFATETQRALSEIGPRAVCFGTTTSGNPKHPLYLKKEAALVAAPTPLAVRIVGDDGRITEEMQALGTAMLRHGGKP